jgi:hypothetical protein
VVGASAEGAHEDEQEHGAEQHETMNRFQALGRSSSPPSSSCACASLIERVAQP